MIKTEATRTISRSSSAERHFTYYAWSVLAFNILVVLWGAYVRATGSGAGCGNHWPMCNGEVLPRAPKLATLIEFTHRATSGIALLAVIGLVIGAFRTFPRGHLARRGAVLAGIFILTEALIGAGLVLLEHVAGNPSVARGWSLSLHLINTFTLLAVLALTAWWSLGHSGMPPISAPLPAAMLASLLLLGVSGAIAALGDTLFPVTSLSQGLAQDLSPSAHIFVRLRVLHPILAAAATVFVFFAVVRTMRTLPHIQTMGVAVIVLVFAQIMIGVLNITMLAPVWMQLIHLAAADVVWVAAVLFCAASSEPAYLTS
jgi:heme A synthase